MESIINLGILFLYNRYFFMKTKSGDAYVGLVVLTEDRQKHTVNIHHVD